MFALIGVPGAAESTRVAWLGMNAATGVLHVVVAALTGSLLAGTWLAKARARPATI